MQYRTAVYITRAEHWSFEERERIPITEAEWLAYVAADGEFRLVTTSTLTVLDTGETFVIPWAHEKHQEWVAYSKHPTARATFQYGRGGIIVRAPDAEVLAKAKAVAAALGARVLSDEMP